MGTHGTELGAPARDPQPAAVVRHLDPAVIAGVPLDPRVRRAHLDEADSSCRPPEHMFTHEIGYPPYSGSSGLPGIDRGADPARPHYIATENSPSGVSGSSSRPNRQRRAGLRSAVVLLGVTRPGMWCPDRGAVEQIMADLAPLVTLYVNDFNTPARAAYRRVGFYRGRRVHDGAAVNRSAGARG